MNCKLVSRLRPKSKKNPKNLTSIILPAYLTIFEFNKAEQVKHSEVIAVIFHFLKLKALN